MKVAKFIVAAACILLCRPALQAQFQKKFTFQATISPQVPLQEALRSDRLPYFFSNFQYGYGGSVNLSYNLSRKFSAGLTAGFSGFDFWQDPRTESNLTDRSFFNIYTLHPTIKYRFFKGKFSPFVLAGAGASVYRGQRSQSTILIDNFYPWDYAENGVYEFVSIDQVLIREPGFKVAAEPAGFILGGFGLELKISETIGISVMACYNSSFASGNYTLDQNLRYFSIPAGINISLGKSKSL